MRLLKALAATVLLCSLIILGALAQGIGAFTSPMATNVLLFCTNITASSILCREAHFVGQRGPGTNNALPVYLLTSTNYTSELGGIPIAVGGLVTIRGGPMGLQLSNFWVYVGDTNDRVQVLYVK